MNVKNGGILSKSYHFYNAEAKETYKQQLIYIILGGVIVIKYLELWNEVDWTDIIMPAVTAYIMK